MELGSTEHGARSMAHGAWNMAHGAWRMEVAPLNLRRVVPELALLISDPLRQMAPPCPLKQHGRGYDHARVYVLRQGLDVCRSCDEAA